MRVKPLKPSLRILVVARNREIVSFTTVGLIDQATLKSPFFDEISRHVDSCLYSETGREGDWNREKMEIDSSKENVEYTSLQCDELAVTR
jgi:hypothetical protein